MKLKNVLLAVNDIEKSIEFYKEFFGLQVLLNQDGNVILTEGLVLQDKKIWQECVGENVTTPNYAMLLYFEEKNIELFWEKISSYDKDIKIITPLTMNESEQKMLRICDFDGHVIEVRCPMY